MRILILIILSSCILFSCKPKDDDTVQPTPTSNTSTEVVDSFSGMMITHYHNGGSPDVDTFPNCKMHLTFYGTDSAMRSRITDLDNNISITVLLPITTQIEANNIRVLFSVADTCTTAETYLHPTDSIYYKNMRSCEPGTNVYFYGKK